MYKRQARKLASVEMTRAMEEATKKAVQLREELGRTEIERKEAISLIKELRSERDATKAVSYTHLDVYKRQVCRLRNIRT